MRWTKKHSKNAVAAKARLRRERTARLDEDESLVAKCLVGKVLRPRTPAPDFRIVIIDRDGNRVTQSVWRIGRRLLTYDGYMSARQIGRGIEMLLCHYKP